METANPNPNPNPNPNTVYTQQGFSCWTGLANSYRKAIRVKLNVKKYRDQLL